MISALQAITDEIDYQKFSERINGRAAAPPAPDANRVRAEYSQAMVGNGLQRRCGPPC